MDSIKLTQAIRHLEELRKKIGELMNESASTGRDNPDLYCLVNDYERLQAETDKICRETLGLSLEESFRRWARA